MCEWILFLHTLLVRGYVSLDFHYYRGDMQNLAYTGAKVLNFRPITGFVYFETKINKACHLSKIQIFGAKNLNFKETLPLVVLLYELI